MLRAMDEWNSERRGCEDELQLASHTKSMVPRRGLENQNIPQVLLFSHGESKRTLNMTLSGLIPPVPLRLKALPAPRLWNPLNLLISSDSKPPNIRI
ncbi:unnamed protein product [Phytomonas sp. Hart1]|nr:unnamed protein product [Phytomonas sp. Hart1]|eukprot:CCW71033.1 unnamed protein product [Phytomonas sp. isolate Hart1]